MQRDTLNNNHTSLPQWNAMAGNDDKGMEQLYRAEYYKTEKYVLQNNGTIEHAKDIYQEAFIAVWRNVQLNRFVPQNETAVAGYLYQVAKNKWIDYLRSTHHKKIVSADELEKGIGLATPLPEEQSNYIESIKKGFKQLGNNCKELLARFYYKNETMKTIATANKWTEATARNNKYRCLEKLRAFVKK